MRLNAMVVLFLPFAALFFAISYWRAIKEESFSWPTVPDPVLRFVLVVIAVFTVVRNF